MRARLGLQLIGLYRLEFAAKSHRKGLRSACVAGKEAEKEEAGPLVLVGVEVLDLRANFSAGEGLQARAGQAEGSRCQVRKPQKREKLDENGRNLSQKARE